MKFFVLKFKACLSSAFWFANAAKELINHRKAQDFVNLIKRLSPWSSVGWRDSGSTCIYIYHQMTYVWCVLYLVLLNGKFLLSTAHTIHNEARHILHVHIW